MVRSPSNDIVALNFAVTPVIVAPPGIPATVTGILAPVALASGTVTLIVPVESAVVPVAGVVGPDATSTCAESFEHIVIVVGETVTADAGVLTVTDTLCVAVQPNMSVPVTV
jgi:hypothetical protein